VSGISMVRNLDENRVEFLRFHNADFIVVLQNGDERLLKKEIWKALTDWKIHATTDAQMAKYLIYYTQSGAKHSTEHIRYTSRDPAYS
jgi:hypothetical protein